MILLVTVGALLVSIAVEQSEKVSRGESASPTLNEESESKLSLETLLNEGSVDQIVDRLIELGTEEKPDNGIQSHLLFDERAKLASRILKLNPNANQHVYATLALLASLSNIDLQNVELKLGLRDTRKMVTEFAEKNLNDPNPKIASTANFVLAIIPIYDFLAYPDPNKIDDIKREFERRASKILNSESTATQYAQVIVNLHEDLSMREKSKVSATEFEKTKSLIDGIVATYQRHPSPDIEPVTRRFQEELLFESLQLRTLTDRITESPSDTMPEVRNFFEVLSEKPTGAESFRLALSVIEAYERMEGRKQAAELANQLSEIAKRVPNEKLRAEVFKDLQVFHERFSDSTTTD